MRPATPGRRFRLAPVLTILVAASWIVGCDFTRVDEGTDVPIQQHVEALATASTPDQAERAIRGVLNKVGVRTAWRADVPDDDLAYGTYFVTDAEIEALAVRHAAFVSGQGAERASAGEVHAAVLAAERQTKEIVDRLEVGVVPFTRAPIRVNADEATLVLSSDATAALRSPESQASAMALAIAADGPTLQTAISADHRLSPAQQFLYTIWIHQNGPFIFPFQTEAGAVARSASGDDCDACCGADPSPFTSLVLQYLGESSASVEIRVDVPGNSTFVPFPQATVTPFDVITLSGDGRTGGAGLAGTIGNEIGIYIGTATTPQASVHTSCSEEVLPGDIYGDFMVIRVTTREGGLCDDIERCAGACESRHTTCLSAATTDGEVAACNEAFRACDFNCHDQGGSR